MRKFFFDDVREVPGLDWEMARDVPQAKTLLLTGPFDVWALDHDIGMEMACHECVIAKLPMVNGVVSFETFKEKEALFADGCIHNETGTALVRWCMQTLTEWPKLVIIHSSNPYGSERMAGLLAPYVDNIKIIPYRNVLWGTIKEQEV